MYTFNPGTGANFPLYSVALATNGDVLIGGAFTLVNGQSRNHPRSVKYKRARQKANFYQFCSVAADVSRL
jgi:hypothetical protein